MAQTAPYGAGRPRFRMSAPIRRVPTWAQELEVASGWIAKAWIEKTLTAAMADMREMRYAGA